MPTQESRPCAPCRATRHKSGACTITPITDPLKPLTSRSTRPEPPVCLPTAQVGPGAQDRVPGPWCGRSLVFGPGVLAAHEILKTRGQTGRTPEAEHDQISASLLRMTRSVQHSSFRGHRTREYGFGTGEGRRNRCLPVSGYWPHNLADPARAAGRKRDGRKTCSTPHPDTCDSSRLRRTSAATDQQG
jgi:hypothetical protein